MTIQDKIQLANNLTNKKHDTIDQAEKSIEIENLQKLYQIECATFKIFEDLRKRGIRFNFLKAKKYLRENLIDQIFSHKNRLILDHGVNYDQLKKYYAKTINKFKNQIDTIKNLELKKTKLTNLIDFCDPKNRIKPTYFTYKKEDGGAVTGRIITAMPNLQGIDKDIRQFILPENDHELLSFDWGQMDLRVILHYSTFGGKKIIEQLRQNPGLDLHSITNEISGLRDRQLVKQFNFGLAYGMAEKTLAEKTGLSLLEAHRKIEQYNKNLPWLKDTADKVKNVAKKRGFVKTLLGRKLYYDDTKPHAIFPHLISGTGADIIKMVLCEAKKKGLFDVLKLVNTSHDEILFSMPKSDSGVNAAKKLSQIMKKNWLDCPLSVSEKVGENWGLMVPIVWPNEL